MEYVVIVHRAEEGGYWVEVSTLSGCFAQGETLEEAMADTQEAISAHLEALREHGHAPSERTMIATVAVG